MTETDGKNFININNIVVVIGMHRSGTSLCSQVLNLLGVDIASERGINTGNEKGHYERWEIVGIQDEILKRYSRSYFSENHDLAMPRGWWSDLEIRDYKDRLKEIIISCIRESRIFGFKDPRTTKLMPL